MDIWSFESPGRHNDLEALEIVMLQFIAHF